MFILAGDVGGTKTSLAILSPERGPRNPVVRRSVRSLDYADLESAVEAFLQDTGHRIAVACVGAAGPLVDGVRAITNLPWRISSEGFRQRLGLDAFYSLNDLEAIAYAIPELAGGDLCTLNAGRPRPHGTAAILAPGTGLGEGYLAWTGTRYLALPSEGGHADFAPNGPLQQRLVTYLAQQFGHVSNERVCSGLGLPNLYAFCRDEQLAPEPDWLREELAQADDPTPAIVNHAQSGDSALCAATLELFVAIMGAEAGNMGLRVLAPGGVFLAGGIPPRILAALQTPVFLKAYLDKGRLSYVLQDTPLHVVTAQDVGLLGAGAYALAQLEVH